MKKSLLVLLLAVLLPSLVLGWLALRSAQEQQIVLERRTAELYQKETDTVATAARSLISAERRAFAETLRQMLSSEKPQQLAGHFAVSLRTAWPQPAVGFALTTEGIICSPNLHDAGSNTQVRQFLAENGSWVSGKAPATAYPVPMDELNRPELASRKSYGELDETGRGLRKGRLPAAGQPEPVGPTLEEHFRGRTGTRSPPATNRRS